MDTVPDLIAFIPFYIGKNNEIFTFNTENSIYEVCKLSNVESTQTLQKHVITDFEINMSIKDFHSYVKINGLTEKEIQLLLYERRKAKNRGYSKVSRLKKKIRIEEKI